MSDRAFTYAERRKCEEISWDVDENWSNGGTKRNKSILHSFTAATSFSMLDNILILILIDESIGLKKCRKEFDKSSESEMRSWNGLFCLINRAKPTDI